MFPNLVGFCGFAFAGKDASADQLVKHDGFKKTYMSRDLEMALLKLNPIVSYDWINSTVERYQELHARVGYDESKKNPEVRRLLQVLGTEIGREMFGENVWIDRAELRINAWLRSGENVAVTGIRFKNELDRIRSLGGTLIWVERPEVVAVNTHVSDNSIGPDDCDQIVQNMGTLDELYERVCRALGGSVPDSPRERMAMQACGHYKLVQRDLAKDPHYLCGEHGWPSRHDVTQNPTALCKAVDND